MRCNCHTPLVSGHISCLQVTAGGLHLLNLPNHVSFLMSVRLPFQIQHKIERKICPTSELQVHQDFTQFVSRPGPRVRVGRDNDDDDDIMLIFVGSLRDHSVRHNLDPALLIKLGDLYSVAVRF